MDSVDERQYIRLQDKFLSEKNFIGTEGNSHYQKSSGELLNFISKRDKQQNQTRFKSKERIEEIRQAMKEQYKLAQQQEIKYKQSKEPVISAFMMRSKDRKKRQSVSRSLDFS